MTTPSYSIERDLNTPKDPELVWENEKPKLRLVVVYTKSGNKPKLQLEKCTKADALGNELWLEISTKEELWDCKDTVLEALAIASANENIMEN